MSTVRVALLPSVLKTADLSQSVAVVIDVLRATTTMVHALAAGAGSVVPCSEIDEAFRIRDQLGAATTVLGGERHGLLIDGFQLDNSPFSYVPEAVTGKTVVFTTTNGTRALAAARTAARVLVGGFVNLGAVVERLLADGRPVWLVCAGTDGFVTAEDVLFAGAVAARLSPGTLNKDTPPPSVADIEALPVDAANATEMAIRFASGHMHSFESRLAALRESRGGRNLLENGFDRDIARAAEVDFFNRPLAPQFHDGRICL